MTRVNPEEAQVPDCVNIRLQHRLGAAKETIGPDKRSRRLKTGRDPYQAPATSPARFLAFGEAQLRDLDLTNDQFHTALGIEFAQDAGNVRLDRLLGKIQFPGDLLVGFPL